MSIIYVIQQKKKFSSRRKRTKNAFILFTHIYGMKWSFEWIMIIIIIIIYIYWRGFVWYWNMPKKKWKWNNVLKYIIIVCLFVILKKQKKMKIASKQNLIVRYIGPHFGYIISKTTNYIWHRPSLYIMHRKIMDLYP